MFPGPNSWEPLFENLGKFGNLFEIFRYFGNDESFWECFSEKSEQCLIFFQQISKKNSESSEN